jgi:putative ATPase
MVACPICDKPVKEVDINRHIDSECRLFFDEPSPPGTQANGTKSKNAGAKPASGFFTPAPKRNVSFRSDEVSSPAVTLSSTQKPPTKPSLVLARDTIPVKRAREEEQEQEDPGTWEEKADQTAPVAKKAKNAHAPLAERMRPQTLDDVSGQELVGEHGVLRNLIVTDRVPSMILWGGPGTGKTTIARLIAQTAGTRFVEINSTSSGVAECKKLFSEAKNELGLTGRKTIIFCDEVGLYPFALILRLTFGRSIDFRSHNRTSSLDL